MNVLSIDANFFWSDVYNTRMQLYAKCNLVTVGSLQYHTVSMNMA